MSTITLYNYAKEQHDELDGFPEDWSEYVPQGAGLEYYTILVEEDGLGPMEAAKEVFRIIIEARKE